VDHGGGDGHAHGVVLRAAGRAAGGLDAYATLSTAVGTPGLGQTLWVVAIYSTARPSIMGAVNYITTILRERAPGMGWFRLPLTVWASS